MGSQFGEVFDEFGIQDHAVAGDLTPVLARLSDELANGSTPFASARAFDFTTSTGETASGSRSAPGSSQSGTRSTRVCTRR